ncbi:MAG: glycoside hydrolase family 3 protein [Bdellovibrionaceae bacterium]|nr:glycoside hydrolase family 3 protein [Pseudobdellovibrionaceae bacterium]
MTAIPNFVLAQESPTVDKMSVEQKVGQLFLIGFPQQRVDSQLENFIKKYKISSFILFKRNISSLSQVAKMNSQLQTLAVNSTQSMPIIAVDQEGGQVARVPTKPPIPNAMSIGQTQDKELALGLGQETAKIIRTLGFNMNLAPVLDISSPKSDSFIGQRSFGSDAEQVSSIGYSVSKGLLEEIVIPTAKHFPGVGSVSGDPHKKQVESRVSEQTFYDRDMKPFMEFAKLGSNTAIMLSHLTYPSLDETNTPATLSPHIIKGILRDKIGYTGLVMTDDIQMKGLTSSGSPHDTALLALKAGADVIMMTWSFKDQAKAIERVKRAVASGELTEEELNEKVTRILNVKDFLHKHTPKLGEIENSKVVALSTKKLREIDARILDFNIKVALRKTTETPLERAPAAAESNVCVFSPNSGFISSFKDSAVKYSAVKTTSTTKSFMLTDYMKKKSCGYGVYVVHGPKTATLLEKMPKDLAQRLLIVNLSSPSLIYNGAKFLNVVNLYFPHPDAGKKIAENLRALARPSSFGEVAHTSSEL